MEVAKAAGVAAPKTVGIIMDNTASPASFTKPMREIAAGCLRPAS
jgi:predicted DNA repair protein MutK